MASVYEIVGEEGFTRLTRAFYARVQTDDILRPMYPDQDFDAAELRLRLFLVFRFGGPDTYIERRGHPRLRLRHAPFPVGPAAAARWLKLMGEALAETGFAAEVEQELRAYFDETARFLINRGDVKLVLQLADGSVIGTTTLTAGELPALEPGLTFRIEGRFYSLIAAQPDGQNPSTLVVTVEE